MQQGGYFVQPKVVVSFKGTPEKLLSGITCNTLDKPQNAFLDRFGKLIVLVDQFHGLDVMYHAFSEKYQMQFLEHLQKFLRLSPTTMSLTSLKVIHCIGGKQKLEGEYKLPQSMGCYVLQKNLPELKEIPAELYETFRIESGIPLQGKDFDQPMFLDIGIDAVSFTKGCYLGQEVIARVDSRGKPLRKLIRILYDKLPEKVTLQGKVVGSISSSCFSQKHGKYLCFAFISDYDKKIDDGELLL